MFSYKDPRWLRKRRAILKRDSYLCQEDRRYGKSTPATTVHHIYPVEQYPQYAFCDWNLISMSAKQHNEMHDRITNQLTAKGVALMERVSPPGGK